MALSLTLQLHLGTTWQDAAALVIDPTQPWVQITHDVDHVFIQALLLDGRLTRGEALRVLRRRHLRLTRREYPARVGLSNSALGDLENDTGNPTLASMEAAFRPFGFRVGMVPVAGGAVTVHGPSLDVQADGELVEAVLASVGRQAG